MKGEREESNKQGQILACIMDYITCYKYPPTIREMSKAAENCSTSVVEHHLNKLSSNGEIERDSGISRGIRLTEASTKILTK